MGYLVAGAERDSSPDAMEWPRVEGDIGRERHDRLGSVGALAWRLSSWSRVRVRDHLGVLLRSPWRLPLDRLRLQRWNLYRPMQMLGEIFPLLPLACGLAMTCQDSVDFRIAQRPLQAWVEASQRCATSQPAGTATTGYHW